MGKFTCDICQEQLDGQFSFFEHLRGHYDQDSEVKDSPHSKNEEKASAECDEQLDAPEIEAQSLSSEKLKDTIVKVDLDARTNHKANVAQPTPFRSTGVVGSALQLLRNDSLGQTLRCQYCQRIFRRQSNLTAHTKSCRMKHDVKKPKNDVKATGTEAEQSTPNPECNSSENRLARKVTTEVPVSIQKPLASPPARFENGVDEDELSYAADGQNMCPACDMTFVTKEQVEEHLKTAHRDAISVAEASKINVDSTNLGEHKKRRVTSDERQEVLQCNLCRKIFNHRNSLVYHLRSHSGDRPHKCNVCGKNFFATSALKVHMRLHSGEKPYKCESCDRTFRQWGDLKYHFISIHSDIRQYQCEFCGKDFARKYSLVVHRRIHTGEKNYKCEYCNKCFRAASYLQNHRRIHTGEKPHVCNICNKPFRVKSDMKRHQTSHCKESTTSRRDSSASSKIKSPANESLSSRTPKTSPLRALDLSGFSMVDTVQGVGDGPLRAKQFVTTKRQVVEGIREVNCMGEEINSRRLVTSATPSSQLRPAKCSILHLTSDSVHVPTIGTNGPSIFNNHVPTEEPKVSFQAPGSTVVDLTNPDFHHSRSNGLEPMTICDSETVYVLPVILNNTA